MAKTRADRRAARPTVVQAVPMVRSRETVPVPVAPEPYRPPSVWVDPDPAGETAAGAALRDAWRAELVAKDATTKAVAAARVAGLSWHQVALVVHYTSEGARRRWGPLLPDEDQAAGVL